MLGRAPVVDFDGTLLALAVDWDALRRSTGVRSIDELWDGPAGAWSPVTAAEVAAAQVLDDCSAATAACRRALTDVAGFAVLTANSEAAVAAFLALHPALACRCRAVVGRESLGGPKRDPMRFAVGLALCDASLRGLRPAEPPTYVGDAAWELDLAARFGAVAVDVATLANEAA